jgi:GNAT superfamily N-acetyltransferase
MPKVEIRNLNPEDEYFVGTCTHTNESHEIDDCANRRVDWLWDMYDKGLRVLVPLINGKQVGFIHIIPIEICPWGPVGEELMVIPCLVVKEDSKGKDIGRTLISLAEKETRKQRKKGLVTTAYYHDFWFMPAPFFEKCGFSKIISRKFTIPGESEYLGEEAILWKVFDSSAKKPKFLKRNYKFESISGKVVVDLFWNTFCQTSNIEAQRVRDVALEFGDSVILNEYCADNHNILLKYQIPRGIFINGREIGWGYEAPTKGIRKAIQEALHH